MPNATPDPLLEILRARFGHADFQPGQREIVEAVLGGDATVAIMPTGAGKSLCYQLPAVAMDGLALVVSPLIALMKDQVDGLVAQGIAADVLNSTRTLEEQRATMAAARSGELDLLYVAPERFGNAWFVDQLRDLSVSLFAIDEAHCISRWGHDFRPDYRRLGGALKALSPRAVLACTATATPEVAEDIGRSLGLDEPRVFVSGFLRENLFIDVRFCGSDRAKESLLIDLLSADPLPGVPPDTPKGTAIVYAPTRKRVDALHALLSRVLDAPVARYHAGMEADERDEAQERFMNGDARVVVATNAFGMGVDRGDVRLVVHAAMPRTVEGYYQEIGRAGRDGEPSLCVMLYNANDSRVHEFLIGQSESPEHRDLETRKLGAMKRYVLSTACRHGEILSYFGERAEVACPGCSRCMPPPQIGAPGPDATDGDLEIARKALAGVARSQGRFGQRKVAAMLAGSRAKEVSNTSLARLSTYGLLADRGVEGCNAILQHLVDRGLCTIEGERFPLINISPRGVEVMTGRAPLDEGFPRDGAVSSPRARRGRSRSASPMEIPEDADPRVLAAVRTWRSDEAGGKPAYTVFGNRTLYALASAPPSSEAEFLALPGLGRSKWQRFGPTLLEVVERALRGEA